MRCAVVAESLSSAVTIVLVKELAVGIATDVLADMNLNMLAVIVTALKFLKPIPERELKS